MFESELSNSCSQWPIVRYLFILLIYNSAKKKEDIAIFLTTGNCTTTCIQEKYA